MSDQVIIFDTTLRDGEQAPGASMTIPEKMEIARALARLGVDVIEAGFPVSSPLQMEGVSRIADELEGPVICALARANKTDIDAAWQAVAHARRSRIHTFIATSDIHIDGKFGHDRYGKTLAEKRRTVLEMAFEAVSYARQYTGDVEFSAEDAGRTDPGYLCDVIAAAIEAGATTLNIPDTTGYCMSNEYFDLIQHVVATCAAGKDVIVSTHCHDDLGLAVANSIAGVRAGARQVECTINGIGERAGNAALEEVVMALRTRRDVFGTDTRINTQQLTGVSRLVSTFSGFPVQPNKAIVGKNAFRHEAGIHQDGMLKRKDTYEIMRPEDVGQDGEGIRLGRHSGRHGLFARLERLALDIPDDRRDEVYQKFLQIADQKKEVYDEDLKRLVGSVPAPLLIRHYALLDFEVQVGGLKKATASVTIKVGKNDVRQSDQTQGDGPVDAIYSAIEHAVGTPYKLTSYTIRSVTEGQDALGEVTVKVEWAGNVFNGKATSTDILRASAEAYIDALNHAETHRASDQFVLGAIMESYNHGQNAPW